MILIYSPASSARLQYILDVIFQDFLGISYSFTSDAGKFNFHAGPKINYSEQAFGNELFIYSTRLLFEKGIRDQQISVIDWQDTKAFFATHPKYIIPFDLFAASFYLLTRYEEYLPHRRDVHGRFDVRDSLAFQKGFLNKPVVDLYVLQLKEIISDMYPALEFPERKFRFLSTIDIDNAWAYKEKGLLRTSGAFLRSLVHLEFQEFAERLLVLLGYKKDPFDTYDELHALQQAYGFKSIYFFLLGDYGENDKNVSTSRKKFQSLINSIADYNAVGIHPSYASNTLTSRIKLEQSRLHKIIKSNVTRSRQHFLKLEFPTTYRNLIECDITDDYTMGYAAEPGFRAGTCNTYRYFDLVYDCMAPLKIHPFVVMDATLNLYKKISPSEVMSFVGPLLKEVKRVNGTFCILWHNESISDKKPWEGWKDVYEEIIKAVYSKN
ncbi:MAG TPA: polysaccharide deacetylase family protein [Bacteroidia bacterium]|nr:polysaccharide deacetylase family protein [Bacteroidia bacterium]HNS12696.1 polysaccharide deacetylase family protein [Bacteroidia bacterium]